MQNVGRAPNPAYQSAVHAAQDEESKYSLTQEMWCRKGNIGTHSMRNPVLEKVRMQTLGFARMDLEQIKGAKLSGIVALGKGAGLLNSPYEFK